MVDVETGAVAFIEDPNKNPPAAVVGATVAATVDPNDAGLAATNK